MPVPAMHSPEDIERVLSRLPYFQPKERPQVAQVVLKAISDQETLNKIEPQVAGRFRLKANQILAEAKRWARQPRVQSAPETPSTTTSTDNGSETGGQPNSTGPAPAEAPSTLSSTEPEIAPSSTSTPKPDQPSLTRNSPEGLAPKGGSFSSKKRGRSG